MIWFILYFIGIIITTPIAALYFSDSEANQEFEEIAFTGLTALMMGLIWPGLLIFLPFVGLCWGIGRFAQRVKR